MSLLLLKSAALLGIGLVTFGGIYLPYWLKKSDVATIRTQNCLAISHSLAGGVFIAAAIMHLIPDAAESIALPIVLILVTVGILFADLVESVVTPNRQHVKGAFSKLQQKVVYVPEQAYVNGEDFLSYRTHHYQHAEALQRSLLLNASPSSRSSPPSNCGENEPCNLLDDEEYELEGLHGHVVHHHHITIGPGVLSWIVLFLLGLHAFITGAALGMTSGVHSTVILGTVIIAHKGVESFAVAINFVESSDSKASIIALVGYGFITPLGAIISATAQEFIRNQSALIIQGVLEGFAAGSFLYVGMMHLQDKTCCGLGWVQAKAIPELIGAGLMIAVSFWI